MFFKPKIDLWLFVGKCVYFAINAPSCDSVMETMEQLRNTKNFPHTKSHDFTKIDTTNLITPEEKKRFDSEVLYFRLFVLNLELDKLNQSLNLGYTSEEIALTLFTLLKDVYEKMGLPEEAKTSPESLNKKFEIYFDKLEKIKPKESVVEKLGEGFYLEQIFTEIVSPNVWNYGTENTTGNKFLFLNQLSTFAYHNMKDFCNTLTSKVKILKKSNTFNI